MGNRRQARELAIQVLFHLEFNPDDPATAFDLTCECSHVKKSIQPFSKRLVLGIYENKKKIDELIENASENWRLDRMTRVDRSILRLAVFEMLFVEDIPPKVSIDEAVELGKKYGTEDSGAFINGILDRIYALMVKDAQ